MKKKDLEGKFIRCLSPEHGKAIIRYFTDNGVANDYNYHGSCVGEYYGISDFTKSITAFKTLPDKAIEIHLPKSYLPIKMKFPREMLVWDDKEENAKKRWVVLIEENKNYPIHVVANNYESSFKTDQGSKEYIITKYKHAKELDEDTSIEITMDEIAELIEKVKGTKVDVKNLKIKK